MARGGGEAVALTMSRMLHAFVEGVPALRSFDEALPVVLPKGIDPRDPNMVCVRPIVNAASFSSRTRKANPEALWPSDATGVVAMRDLVRKVFELDTRARTSRSTVPAADLSVGALRHDRRLRFGEPPFIAGGARVSFGCR